LLETYKNTLIKTEGPLTAARLYFTEACVTLLKDLSPDQSIQLGNQFSKLLRNLKTATSKKEKLSNIEIDPKPLRLKPFITCSPALRESITFKEIQAKEKAAQDSYIKTMKDLMTATAVEEHKAAIFGLVNFMCDSIRKFANYIFLSRHKDDIGVVQYEDCIDAIAFLAFKKAITPRTTIPAPPDYKKYWFGLDVAYVEKELFTFDDVQYARAEGNRDLYLNQGADLCTKAVQNMTKIIICGAIDVYFEAINKQKIKEDIESIFQSTALEEATKQTVIDLENDGPDNVTSATINKAQMNQIMTSLRKEFILTPKNESGGATTESASITKKKSQHPAVQSAKKKKKKKEREAIAMAKASLAAKATIKAARAQAKAVGSPGKKKRVEFSSGTTRNNDSKKQKKSAASKRGQEN
jgi:hypothetical protein